MELFRYALINASGAVIGAQMAPDGWTDPDGSLCIKSDTANIGDTYANGAFAHAALAPSALLSAASAQQEKILVQTWSFDVGTPDTPLTVTTKLDPNGQVSMMKLVLWGQLNASNGGATEPYSNVDYSTATLTPAQAISLGAQAGAVVSATYAVLNQLATGINASPPTITTLAQVTGASWPTPST